MLLKFAIQQFKEDREFKQIAKATMTNYMGCLKEFHHYCVEREIVDVAEITTSTIKQYLPSAEDKARAVERLFVE